MLDFLVGRMKIYLAHGGPKAPVQGGAKPTKWQRLEQLLRSDAAHTWLPLGQDFQCSSCQICLRSAWAWPKVANRVRVGCFADESLVLGAGVHVAHVLGPVKDQWKCRLCQAAFVGHRAVSNKLLRPCRNRLR